STCCAPGVKSELLIDCGLWVEPLFWVIDRITSGMLVKPWALICSAVTTVIGEGPSTCARGMREPVTCTVSRSVTGLSAAEAGGCCAVPPGAGVDAGEVDCAPAGTITTAPEGSRWARNPLPRSNASSA